MTEIWYSDPCKTFLSKDTVLDFIPEKSMSLVLQLNAAMRFVLYFAIIMFALDPLSRAFLNSLSTVIVVGLVTAIIHLNETKDDCMKKSIMEHLNLQYDPNNNIGAKPTKDNPFMNFSFDDHLNFPSHKASDPLSTAVQAEIQVEFDKNQFHDVDDVFNRQNSTRQFYTMPCTSIVNDRESFMKACYNLPKTRKEESIQTWATLTDKYDV